MWRAVSDRLHRNLSNIIFVAPLEKQPIFNIKSAGCRQSMVLDNRTPSARSCPRRTKSSRNNGLKAEGREILGNRAKLNILCPLWSWKEDKCVCARVCLCVRERDRTFVEVFCRGRTRNHLKWKVGGKKTYTMGEQTVLLHTKVRAREELVRTKIYRAASAKYTVRILVKRNIRFGNTVVL